MMNTFNASKGKVPLKGKGKQESGKAENQDGVQHVMSAGSQQDALKGIIVPSIVQEDSQADVQSAAQLVILPLSALVQ